MNKLRHYRLKNNISTKDVAAHIGVKPRAILFYELGQRMPNIHKAIKLAKLYNTTVEELWGEGNHEWNHKNNRQRPSDKRPISVL